MKLCDVRNNQWVVLYMFGMKMEQKKVYLLFFLVRNIYGTFFY